MKYPKLSYSIGVSGLNAISLIVKLSLCSGQAARSGLIERRSQNQSYREKHRRTNEFRGIDAQFAGFELLHTYTGMDLNQTVAGVVRRLLEIGVIFHAERSAPVAVTVTSGAVGSL